MKSLDFKLVFQYLLYGALAFGLGGIVAGFILQSQEGLLGFSAEGSTGGLILGLLLRKSFRVGRIVLASTLAILLGLFSGAFIGLLIYDDFGVPALISGCIAGAVFGAVMGLKKELLIFALSGTLIFFSGGLVLNAINVWNGPFYNFIHQTLGETAYEIIIVTLTALYHGMGIGLGLGIHQARQPEDA